jgi:hypothetical protein
VEFGPAANVVNGLGRSSESCICLDLDEGPGSPEVPGIRGLPGLPEASEDEEPLLLWLLRPWLAPDFASSPEVELQVKSGADSGPSSLLPLLPLFMLRSDLMRQLVTNQPS